MAEWGKTCLKAAALRMAGGRFGGCFLPFFQGECGGFGGLWVTEYRLAAQGESESHSYREANVQSTSKPYSLGGLMCPLSIREMSRAGGEVQDLLG